MRLCERDGSFDFSAYEALNTRVSWEETQRIMASLVIIGDERADYGEWRAKDKDNRKKGIPTDVALSFNDYKRELDEARGGLAAIEAEMVKHRRAVLANSDERMTDVELTMCENLTAAYKQKIEFCEAQLTAMIAEHEGATHHDGGEDR